MCSIIERLDEIEGERRRLAAESAALVREIEAAGRHHDDGFRSVRSWMRWRYRLSEPEATGRMREARAVELDVVAEAWSTGQVSGCAVRELGRAASNPRCGDQLADVIEVLVATAKDQRHVDLQQLVRQWERLADADGAAPDPEVLHSRRRLHLRQDLDGAFHLTARLGNTQGLIAEEILERFHSVELEDDLDVARASEVGAPLPRSVAQRYADAFVAALVAATGAPGDARPAEPLINVTTDQDTFEHHLIGQLSTDVPEPLDPTRFMERVSWSRHGSWVHPATLPALALVGHVRRVVFDSAGVTIDLGRRHRLFTGSAREAVLVAQPRCTSPGCHVAAHHCEIDHITPWASGGRTDQHNARVRCGRHHRDHTSPGPDPPAGRLA